MKEYPSIPKVNEPNGKHCIAFEKLDGSSIRVEWSAKQGWYKFGSRKKLLYQEELAEAKTLFMERYAEPLAKAIVDYKELNKPLSAMAFLEFFGPHSFSGKHDPQVLGVPSNNPKDLVLFDINIHKKGMCGPKRFLDLCRNLRIPKVVYEGPMDEEFVLAVRNGEYNVKEGVVCKGGDGFDHSLWMNKIKTFAFLEELKNRFRADWEKE